MISCHVFPTNRNILFWDLADDLRTDQSISYFINDRQYCFFCGTSPLCFHYVMIVRVRVCPCTLSCFSVYTPISVSVFYRYLHSAYHESKVKTTALIWGSEISRKHWRMVQCLLYWPPEFHPEFSSLFAVDNIRTGFCWSNFDSVFWVLFKYRISFQN